MPGTLLFMRALLTVLLAATVLSCLQPPARAATFEPPGEDWRTIETPHFRIHFPAELRAIARQAAVYAENAHERLGPYFGRPNDVTEMTILDTEDTTNGFATPFPEARLTFFVTPPSPDEEWYTGRYDNWLKMVISHEYTHVLQARASAGPLLIPGFLNAMFVRAFLPDFAPLVTLDFLPDFLKEGMAVYQESLFTGGGRALEGQFDMILRTQFEAGTVFAIDQASGRYSLDWAPGGANYLYGVAFYSYVVSHYGDMAAAKLTKRLGEFPWGGINLAAERTFGKSTYALWNEAMAYYRHRYQQQIAEIRQQPLTSMQYVTHSGRNHRHPKWLDGDTLTYTQSPLGGSAAIVQSLANKARATVAGLAESKLDGTDYRFLLAKASDKDYTLSPDHHEVYYYDDGDSPPHAEFHDLYRFDLASGKVQQVTHGMRASFPCPSPDGREILAVLNGDGRNDLGMFDLDGKLLWRLRGPDFGSFASPAWSPDGKHVALVQWTDGHTNIVLLDPATHTLVRPAPDDAVQLYPTWSPDGQTLLFASDRTGIMNLHAVRLSDGSRYRVTNVIGGAFDPSVSPDGTKIALSTYGPHGFDIAVMPYDPGSWLPEDPNPTTNAQGHPLGAELALAHPPKSP
ncbi:MAG: PD40 domain-containing protein, partial [Cyanobacteria bacterium REEB65]|nr:PD40 domain-containing protein [Cyanobacteria bacterium REEB65]